MPGGDEVPVRLDETPHVLTVHGERKRLVERTLYRRIRPPQNAERDPCALRGGFVFVHHPQLARKTEFQREAADNPHQKAIQGSDLREVLRRDHLAEKRRVLRILLGAFGQQRHKPLEDLARRRTRERERDDFLRLHLTTDQVYEPLRQRLRLAGPRRRLDEHVRDHGPTSISALRCWSASQAASTLSSGVLKIQAPKSHCQALDGAGGQKMPRSMRSMSSRIFTSASAT